MAEKPNKSGGGGFTWLIIGFLLGVVATLAALAFLAHDPDSSASLGEAKAAPSVSLPQSPGASLPAPTVAPDAQAQAAPAATPAGPMPADPGADSGDSQMADDAAAAGMTSKAQPR